jgi:hypothetical protein
MKKHDPERPVTFRQTVVLETLVGAQPSSDYRVESQGGHNKFLPFLKTNYTPTRIRVCRKLGISSARQIINIDPPLNRANDPEDLDRHRSRAGRRKGYREIRRHRLHAFQADKAIPRRRQEDLKFRLLGATSATWPDAVAMANYLIDLITATPRTRDIRRGEFATHRLDNLTRLGDRMKEQT